LIAYLIFVVYHILRLTMCKFWCCFWIFHAFTI